MRTVSRRAVRAFTLLEVLIVVTVIALLAGILIPSLTQDAERARDSRRAADLRSVSAALAYYKQDHGVYPSTGDAWWGDDPAYGGYGYDANGYIPGLVPDYLPFLPKDPNPSYPNGTGAGYMYRSDGQDYKFVILATPSTYFESNPFYDPVRPDSAWQVSSPGGYDW